jgi:hypothetical protein
VQDGKWSAGCCASISEKCLGFPKEGPRAGPWAAPTEARLGGHDELRDVELRPRDVLERVVGAVARAESHQTSPERGRFEPGVGEHFQG